MNESVVSPLIFPRWRFAPYAVVLDAFDDGAQGALFAVAWKYFEELLRTG